VKLSICIDHRVGWPLFTSRWKSVVWLC